MDSNREHVSRRDDPHAYRPGADPALQDELDAIVSWAWECTKDPDEVVQAVALGSIDTIDWIRGVAEQAPSSRRRLPGLPSLVDLAIEYEAALGTRATSGYQVRFAGAIGVVDVLRFLVSPYGGTPWWAKIANALPAVPRGVSHDASAPVA